MQKFIDERGCKMTPQNQPIPGRSDMSLNHEGGYVFTIDDLNRFKRFLIIGTESGSYYQSEKELTIKNCQNLIKLISLGKSKEMTDMIVNVSEQGLAPKNDAALFSLAAIMTFGSPEEKRYASENLNKVARIGTHILQFVSYADKMRGYGKLLRKTISNWYYAKSDDQLAFQLLKYKNRAGWTHKDVFRMIHLKPKSAAQNRLFKYIVKEGSEILNESSEDDIIEAYEIIKATNDENVILNLIQKFNLPMEFIPTEKRTKKIWEYVIPNAGLTFLLRNLGNMSKHNILVDKNIDLINLLANKFSNPQNLQKARIHPINILISSMTYQSGKGVKGSGTWNPVQKIVDVLDDAFYQSFKFIEPSDKKILIGLDISASMCNDNLMGVEGLTPRSVSAAMAMATMRSEKNWMIMGFSQDFMPLKISPKQRLTDVVDYINCLSFGATDCSLPMQYALKNKIPVDLFVIYTDSETGYWDIHPTQALDIYRQKMGINSRLLVSAMTASEFSIADPTDLGMIDIVGFSSDTPSIISSFSKGEF